MNVAGLRLVGSSCIRSTSDRDSDKCILSLPPRFSTGAEDPSKVDEVVMNEDFEAVL